MFYTIEVTENSSLVNYSISQSKITAIDEMIYFLKVNGYDPAENSTICVTMKAMYFNQFGKKVTKYTNGKFTYFKYFTIYKDQFSVDFLDTEMKQRFLK